MDLKEMPYALDKLKEERRVLLEKLYSMISDKPWPDEYSLVLIHLLEDIEENEKSLEQLH